MSKGISVVLPNYNGVGLFPHTLPTVFEALENTKLPYEIIVVDDCSTDNSVVWLQENYPSIKILALSMSGQGNVVSEMINDADISGYVVKNIGKKELTEAIEKIASGGIYFSDVVLDELGKFSNIKKQNEETHLTQREVEIVGLIEKELSNKEIADKLFISERTVETHRKNIFRKTKTNSVIGLVKYAYEHKLI